MNRIILIGFLSAIVLLTIFIVGANRARVVPGRFQSALEMIFDFVRKNIAVEVLGEELGRKYFNIIATIFVTVFALNITGIIPFLNIARTSLIGMPLVFALWVFALYVGASVKKFGVLGFLKVATVPPGVPKALYLLLTPVEFLQTFLLRPATLTVRLFANMLAGHLLLALCFGATNYLFLEAEGGMKLFGLVTISAGAFFFLLEAFVAALQAYVFAILTAIYLQMVVKPEH